MVSLVFFLVFREESLKEVSRVLFCPPYSHHCRRPGPVSFLRRKYISHSYHGPMRRDPRDSVRSCPLFIACPAQTRYQYVIKARTKPRWTGVGRGGLLASQNTSFTSHHSPGAVHVQVLCVYAAGAPSGEVAQQQPRTRQGIVADVAQERTRQCSRASRRRKLVRRVTARPLPTRTCSAVCVRPCFYEGRPTTHPPRRLTWSGKIRILGAGQERRLLFPPPCSCI